MLEHIDLTKSMKKKEFSELMETLAPQLALLQRQAKAANIPVTIIFEGFDFAGKGKLINRLISCFDPRGFEVCTTKTETEEEKMHPFLWRFWKRLPARGRIAVFDNSWYRSVLSSAFDHDTPKEKIERHYREINAFEKQLSDDGMVIIKFFLVISEKEQKTRMKTLLASEDTQWRVSDAMKKRVKGHEKYAQLAEKMFGGTSTSYAPWYTIEATDHPYAAAKIISTVTTVMANALAAKEAAPKPVINPQIDTATYRTAVLSSIDLDKSLTDEEYKEKKKELQKKLSILHNKIYNQRIPVVLVFEGWDAGGKGGAIKRLTEALDPRGYVVNPVASPNATERAYHYLWRFWTKFPKDGHIAIFDRSWYGRVMVERLEGFCSQDEWQRAYQEMNEMEAGLVGHGTVVLKFWMHIDKDEQERRFKERQETPDKQWKITDEDWRNREKWDSYEVAVDEMLLKTSTPNAPWIIVEANDKHYARIKVLETVVAALEKAVK
ncbi:MAG: polyphosphate:AMP phosphotransferase [Lachnospiraceae bacterium]